MPEEYFDVAYINHEEAILHGRMTDGRDEQGFTRHREVRLALSDQQKLAIEDMNFEHQQAMTKLLAGFAHAS